MSKANRRRQRPGSRPTTNRPTTPPPSAQGNAAADASGTAGAGTPGASPAGAGGSASVGSTGSAGAVRPGTPRPTGTGSRPTAARHGRRERQRASYKPSFFERYRTAIIIVAALAGVALLSVFVFASAAQPAFACSTIWTPSPTPAPAAGATPNLGYVQPDMGNDHVPPGQKVTYTYCAPASGSHYNAAGRGPIAARVYGPGDSVIPQGWVHNLEHGGLVILYTGTSTGATAEGQAAFKTFFEDFPPIQPCGPVIARFDDMSTPFQALLWGRVLPMDKWDPELVKAYWQQWGGRTNLEQLCPTPNTGATPSSSAGPSTSPGASTSAAPSISTAPSAAPSAAPTAVPSPSGSAAPSPS